MKRQLLCLLAAFASAACADVTVHFEQPDRFTDLGLSGASTVNIQADLMRQLEKHIKALGVRFLSKGDTLEITLLDIDMAGAYEPWRSPNITNTRFIRDIYPPRFSMHYTWRDKSGKLIADKQENITDLNYLNLLDSRQYNTTDPLRYEKSLLDRWFRETFTPTEKEGTEAILNLAAPVSSKFHISSGN